MDNTDGIKSDCVEGDNHDETGTGMTSELSLQSWVETGIGETSSNIIAHWRSFTLITTFAAIPEPAS
jgi:hypothetical protein